MVMVAGLLTTKEDKPQCIRTFQASHLLLVDWLKQVKWLSLDSEDGETVYLLVVGVAKLQRGCAIQGFVGKLGTIIKTIYHTSIFISHLILKLVHVSVPLLELFFLLAIYPTTHCLVILPPSSCLITIYSLKVTSCFVNLHCTCADFHHHTLLYSSAYICISSYQALIPLRASTTFYFVYLELGSVLAT